MQNERGKPYCPPMAFTAVSKTSSVALGVAALPALRLAASAIALLSLAQMCGSGGIVEVVMSVGGARSTEGERGEGEGARREEETGRVRDEEEKERQRQRQVCEREAQSERAGGQGIAGATFHYRTSVTTAHRSVVPPGCLIRYLLRLLARFYILHFTRITTTRTLNIKKKIQEEAILESKTYATSISARARSKTTNLLYLVLIPSSE